MFSSSNGIIYLKWLRFNLTVRVNFKSIQKSFITKYANNYKL